MWQLFLTSPIINDSIGTIDTANHALCYTGAMDFLFIIFVSIALLISFIIVAFVVLVNCVRGEAEEISEGNALENAIIFTAILCSIPWVFSGFSIPIAFLCAVVLIGEFIFSIIAKVIVRKILNKKSL